MRLCFVDKITQSAAEQAADSRCHQFTGGRLSFLKTGTLFITQITARYEWSESKGYPVTRIITSLTFISYTEPSFAQGGTFRGNFINWSAAMRPVKTINVYGSQIIMHLKAPQLKDLQ